ENNPHSNYDVVVPESERGLEPLHAFYSKNCIEPIREQLDGNALKMTDFLSKVKVRVVTLGEVKHIENIYNALVNLNTQEEYQTAMSSER
ncbi:MAG: molybdenum cofactor guanylyltransferase, partial [Candidatus Brocadiales bacterium]